MDRYEVRPGLRIKYKDVETLGTVEYVSPDRGLGIVAVRWDNDVLVHRYGFGSVEYWREVEG